MFPQSIVTADVIKVDYDSAKFVVDGKNGKKKVATRFFCTILVRGGFIFRHTSQLLDEATASNVTEKIYNHVQRQSQCQHEILARIPSNPLNAATRKNTA